MSLTTDDSQDVLGRLALLNSDLTAAVGEIASAHQISASQFYVLRVLLGSWPDPLTCSDIGCNLLDRTPDVTRLLDRLDKAGLIQRERSTEDRRVIHVHLSQEGRALTKEVEEQVGLYEQRLLQGLSRQERHHLTELLERIRL